MIVRKCRDLWENKYKENPQFGITHMIKTLRDDGIIQKHQANMMFTLVNLRNLYVYDRLELETDEKFVAYHAWKIVKRWMETDSSSS